jgi:hypothetical protein
MIDCHIYGLTWFISLYGSLHGGNITTGKRLDEAHRAKRGSPH